VPAESFYTAFKALRFNGIDGDFAEFGSWGAMTSAFAYHEARRHGPGAALGVRVVIEGGAAEALGLADIG
jgi:hypothetical protein